MNSYAYAWWTGAAAPMSFDHSEADQIKSLNNTLQEQHGGDGCRQGYINLVPH